MQFPESWLREFCNPPLSTQEVADVLTMAGLEVEEMRPVAPATRGVVVGEIKAVQPHPNADRLRVCQVDVGQSGLLNIVCGAPNARAGLRVPCALVGAELPADDDAAPVRIELGTLRGVQSQGMLCSSRELRLSDAHAGLLELASDAPVGQDIRTYLQLDDTLFTLKLTPNLAHCLSVYGVARELAALTGAPLKPLSFPSITPHVDETLPVKISAPDLCGRFSGRTVRFLDTQATTPDWMVQRLERCGQRSVSALVDISNYVMFELGRPSHIFDLEKIQGGLDVRWGRPGEQLKLLNGQTVAVDAGVGVIADEAQVESLAGIMGGDATAVSAATRHVYVEAAFWWPKAVAGRSRRYGFATDAGHRFERGVDPEWTVQHIERITQLIVEICGTSQTQCGPIDDHRINLPQAQSVTLRVSRAAKVLGMPVTQVQCTQALARLGLAVTEADGIITTTPPSYRFDLQLEEDLIEEVIRMIGYDKLPHTPPQAPLVIRVQPQTQRSTHAVRRALAALGYQESINYSFVQERWEHELAGNAQPVRLINPIASQMSVMRSSLIGSLLQVIKFNQDRRSDRVRVFEVGRVFMRDLSVSNSDTTVGGFHQPMRIAAMACGSAESLQWGSQARAVDFYDAKGDVQAMLAPVQARFEPAQHPAMHPGRCASVWLGDKLIGYVGELHPRWVQSYELSATPVLFELELDDVLRRPLASFKAVAKHQPVQRDIAVIVGESVSHGDLMRAIGRAATQGLLQEAVLFDVYRATPEAQPQTSGLGLTHAEKSLTVRLTLCANDVNLSEEQISAAVQAVLGQLATDVGARLRT